MRQDDFAGPHAKRAKHMLLEPQGSHPASAREEKFQQIPTRCWLLLARCLAVRLVLPNFLSVTTVIRTSSAGKLSPQPPTYTALISLPQAGFWPAFG